MAKAKIQPPPTSERLRRAARQLLGALLRNPHELVNYVNRINPARVVNLGEYAKTVGEILNQFQTTGTYNIFAVERKSGVSGLRQVMQEDTDIFLGDAVEVFTQEYEFWASEAAHLYAVTQGQVFADAQKARDAFAEMSDLLKLDVDAKQTDWRAEAEQWAHNKLSGIEPVYPCVNVIPGYCDVVPFFEPCLYYIIGARPGMGKTHIALNLMTGFIKNGAKGIFYSLEMSPLALAKRVLGQSLRVNTKVDISEWPADKVERFPEEMARITSKSSGYEIEQLYTIEEICSDALVRSLQGRCQFVIIDYAQKIETARWFTNADAKAKYISSKIQRLAHTIKAPVIVLAQLSRAVEARPNKRPNLSDLRESGNYEQDADCISFLYRAEYYDILEDENGESLRDVAEIITAKNRDDSTGTARCAYNGCAGFYGSIEQLRTEQMYRNAPATQFPAMAKDVTEPAPAAIDWAKQRSKNEEEIPF